MVFNKILLFVLLKFFCCGILFSGQAFASPDQQTASMTLTFGVLPYLSSNRLFKQWYPVAQYIESKTGFRIVIKSAPEYNTFFKRTLENQYDITFTAPHLAAFAIKKHGFRLLVKLSGELYANILVPIDSPYQNILDLKHKVIATPDRLALMTVLGELRFKDEGLSLANRNVSFKYTHSHNNALLSLESGKADAAVIYAQLMPHMPAKLIKQVRSIARTKAVPWISFIASHSMDAETFTKIKDALYAANSDAEGIKLFIELGYGKPILPDEKDLESFEDILKLMDGKLLEKQ